MIGKRDVSVGRSGVMKDRRGKNGEKCLRPSNFKGLANRSSKNVKNSKQKMGKIIFLEVFNAGKIINEK